MSEVRAETGLVKYDSMCRAIEVAHAVDEVKDIRDKAMALQKYAEQARNFDAEKRAASIRIRAELKAGELLKATEKGSGPGRGKKSNGTKSLYAEAREAAQVSADQAANWQRLASNPQAVTDYLDAEESVPTTAGALAAAGKKSKPKDVPLPISDDVLWLCGRLGDLHRASLDFSGLINGTDKKTRADLRRYLDDLLPKLQKLRRQL